MKAKIVWRGLLVLAIDAAALILLAAVLPGFTLDDGWAALAAAAAIGILNALVWPVLARVALPLTVLTLGGVALLLNGLLVTFAINLIPGAHVDGVFDGIVITIGISAVTSIFYALLAIDEDETWYRNVVSRQVRGRRATIDTEVPGIAFLEIDGLAHEVLRRAVIDGNAPHIGRWLRSGSHRLERWETDWSSQTRACQAGLLHGDNDDMPAFRWWENDRGTAIVTNHPRDAEELERRHSDGRGLLHADGASRANILSGDAPHSMLTMSTALTRRRPIGRDYSSYFARAPTRSPARSRSRSPTSPASAGAARSQVRDDVRPRISRPRTYALIRAWATVVQRDLQVATVVGDLLAGRPVIYTTFLAYDEVAHHSGIERHDALAVLRDLDRQIARIEAAARDAPRPYRLVVLSDHGQSQGETFLDRFGETLEDLVRGACDADSMVAVTEGGDDALGYMSAGLTEFARDDTMAGRTVRTVTRGRVADGAVALDADVRQDIEETHGGEVPELSVMASGCLGLITFPRTPGRVTLEQLETLHPRLLPALRDHPGIGFVLVRSERRGAMAIGARGVNFLDEDEIEGEDPLLPFGPHAVDHVRRTDAFPHCPDLVVNSTFWEDFEEVAAFEELVGSHGGMGGSQSHPLVVHPADLPWSEEEVVGAESVHRIFRGWLAGLGHDAYADSEVASPGSSTRTST